MSVTSDSVRENEAVGCTDAEKVIEIHYNGVLRDVVERGKIARFLVFDVSERGFRTCAVSVHSRTVFGITAGIGNDLAERSCEYALILL